MPKSKSAKYYASNPEARKKKAAYDTAYHKKPKARKYRAELNAERRERGIYGKGGGDLAHQSDGSLKRQSASKNRANNRPKKRNSK